MLKTTGVFLTGLVGTSGSALADPGKERGGENGGVQRGPPAHSNAPDWVRFENNRLEMVASESEWRAADASAVKGVPDEATIVPYDIMKKTLQTFNGAVAAGDAKFHKQGKEIEFVSHDANDRSDWRKSDDV